MVAAGMGLAHDLGQGWAAGLGAGWGMDSILTFLILAVEIGLPLAILWAVLRLRE